MKTILTFVISLTLSLMVSAQFGTAPNFIVTDINGTNFHLYEELNAGKPVILASMATWSEVSFSTHNQHFLEELYQKYGSGGTNQIQILFYEGDANTTMQDLIGEAGNTIGNWINDISYPIVNESTIQLPLEIFAPQGFPSIRIIRPSDYEITNDVSYAEDICEIKDALNNIITLIENTGQDFSLNYIATDVSCFEANDGQIQLDIVNGCLPYQIEWSDGSLDTNRQNLPAGEYTVTVLNTSGETLSENVIINEPPALQITNVDILSEIDNQQNGSISFIVEGGTPPYNFEWSTGNMMMDLEGIESGEYSITVVDQNFCELIETFFVDLETSIIEPSLSKLLLFPNPVTHSIHIKNLKVENVIYEITNNLGQVIDQGIVLNEIINLENLVSGFYQISFRCEKEEIRKQFIKL